MDEIISVLQQYGFAGVIIIVVVYVIKLKKHIKIHIEAQ